VTCSRHGGGTAGSWGNLGGGGQLPACKRRTSQNKHGASAGENRKVELHTARAKPCNNRGMATSGKTPKGQRAPKGTKFPKQRNQKTPFANARARDDSERSRAPRKRRQD
jgi:hypothetical protein